MDIHVLSESELSPFFLPDGAPRRDMPRPPEFRQPGYEDQFDFTTVFFSAFRNVTGEACLVGPSLLNFEPHVRDARLSVLDGSSVRHDIAPEQLKLRNGWCQSILTFPAPADHEVTLQMDLGVLGQHEAPLQPYLGGLFRGKRVALTMIKYDPLVWVRDWAEFYVRAHGTNAVLVYNNQAPDYTGADIAEALRTIAGLETVVVVDWPFKYGPQAAGTGHWDSVFCKTGAFQHARYALLAEAVSVVNTDVDELIIHPGLESIHEAVERSPEKHIRIGGVWASNSDSAASLEKDIRKRRHRDFTFRTRMNHAQCPPKWAVVPSSYPAESQWVTHRIRWYQFEKMPLHTEFCFRHFRNLNSSWKRERAAVPKTLTPDDDMRKVFRAIGWLQS